MYIIYNHIKLKAMLVACTKVYIFYIGLHTVLYYTSLLNKYHPTTTYLFS
jgi:hypothetical protein